MPLGLVMSIGVSPANRRRVVREQVRVAVWLAGCEWREMGGLDGNTLFFCFEAVENEAIGLDGVVAGCRLVQGG